MATARKGIQLAGDHSTLTEAATPVAKYISSLPGVKRLSPGHIISKRGGRGKSVKITPYIGGLLLTISQNGSIQEVRVLCDGGETITTMLSAWLTERGIQVRYGNAPS